MSRVLSRIRPVEPRGFRPAISSVRPQHHDAGLQPEPDICPSCAFLVGRLIDRPKAQAATRMAATNGSCAAEELIAEGSVSEDGYYRALAAHLGLDFVEDADIAHPVGTADRQAGSSPVNTHQMWCQMQAGDVKLIIAPPLHFQSSERMGPPHRGAAQSAIATPATVRRLLMIQQRDNLADQAVSHLIHTDPAMSAHSGARFWQGAMAALFIIAGLFAFTQAPGGTTLAFHLALSVFFFSCVWLRVMAASAFERRPLTPLHSLQKTERPHYSVLVCLYKEAAVVPDLVRALNGLRWPHSRLQILLVCEEDDEDTLAAIERHDLPPCFEIVRVPAVGPRTKPKALNYALAFARGSLVTIYDAEDRPHPDQLTEAWQTFGHSAPNIACLQAPLMTANLRRNAITALFHFEYAGLFGGMLPWLARMDLPILLGGTSNHFRREALQKVGGWDPYNVTEDADLGLRLWRAGYRTAMITRPTLEDAPHDWQVWLRQRTRWYKGWLQTWVVHSRQPVELFRNVGFWGFITTQILLAGTLLSALAHPFVLFNAIWLTVWIASQPLENAHLSAIATLDWSIVLLSYAAFIVLCWQAMPPRARRHVAWAIPLVPLYWLAQSAATWRAVAHLFTKPFEWEKTPHSAHQSGFGSSEAGRRHRLQLKPAE